MNLNGAQREQLYNAILSGFDQPNLQRLVEFELNQRLDQIARGNNLADDVSELVRWAERNGSVPQLVKALHERNPDNPDIQKLWQDYQLWSAVPTREDSAEERTAPISSERQSIPLWLIALLAVAMVALLVGAVWWSLLGPNNMSPNQSNSESSITTVTLSTDTPIPDTPIPNTPIPDTPIPNTPIPDTPIPNTPIPNTPIPNTPIPDAPTTDTSNTVTIGDVVEGEIIFDEWSDWIFNSGPATIDIMLDMGSLGEAQISVFDAAGDQIYPLDTQTGPIEHLINFEIPDEQSYTISARNLLNEQTDYTLAITRSAEPQPISASQTVTGTLYGIEGNSWVFEDGPAMLSLTLTLEPLYLDSTGNALIMVFDAVGNQLNYIDSQAGAVEQRPNVQIPNDKPYTLFVRNQENRPAKYTFSIEGVP